MSTRPAPTSRPTTSSPLSRGLLTDKQSIMSQNLAPSKLVVVSRMSMKPMVTPAGRSQTLPFGKSKVYRFNQTQLLTFCRLNFSNPTILDLHNSSFNNQYAVISEDYNHGFVYLIITAQNTTGDNKTLVAAAHPIHLHGHDFVILGQNSTTYSVTETPKTFNYINPPRRDVALLPQNGYLAIAFKPDNPGVWLVHCHIGEFLLSHLASTPSLKPH